MYFRKTLVLFICMLTINACMTRRDANKKAISNEDTRPLDDTETKDDSNAQSANLTTEGSESFFKKVAGDIRQSFETFKNDMTGQEPATETEKILDQAAVQISATSDEKIADALASKEYDDLKSEIEKKAEENQEGDNPLKKEHALIFGVTLVGVGLIGPAIWRWSIYKNGQLVFDPFEHIQAKVDAASRVSKAATYLDGSLKYKKAVDKKGIKREYFYSDQPLNFEEPPFKVDGKFVKPQLVEAKLVEGLNTKHPLYAGNIEKILKEGIMNKYSEWIKANGGDPVSDSIELKTPRNPDASKFAVETFGSDYISMKEYLNEDQTRFRSPDAVFDGLPQDSVVVRIMKQRYTDFTKAAAIEFDADGIATKTMDDINISLTKLNEEAINERRYLRGLIYNEYNLKRFVEPPFVDGGKFKARNAIQGIDPQDLDEYEKFLKAYGYGIDTKVEEVKNINKLFSDDFNPNIEKNAQFKQYVAGFVDTRAKFNKTKANYSKLGKASLIAGILVMATGVVGGVVGYTQLNLTSDPKDLTPTEKLMAELIRIGQDIDAYKKVASGI